MPHKGKIHTRTRSRKAAKKSESWRLEESGCGGRVRATNIPYKSSMGSQQAVHKILAGCFFNIYPAATPRVRRAELFGSCILLCLRAKNVLKHPPMETLHRSLHASLMHTRYLDFPARATALKTTAQAVAKTSSGSLMLLGMQSGSKTRVPQIRLNKQTYANADGISIFVLGVSIYICRYSTHGYFTGSVDVWTPISLIAFPIFFASSHDTSVPASAPFSNPLLSRIVARFPDVQGF